MKYEFKKGDKIRRINKSLPEFNIGETATVTEDISTDYGEESIYFKSQNGIVISCYVENVELVAKENSKPKVLKAPTHIVIWEEDRDPCKFFVSEKEAKDFIKELSNKSNVQKDSIVLVEIKSCKKVQIQKSLRFNPHKI